MFLSDSPECRNVFLCTKPRVQQIAVTEALSSYLPHQRYVLCCQAKQRIILLRILTIRWKKHTPGRRCPAGIRYKANKGSSHVWADAFPDGSAPEPHSHDVKAIGHLTPVAGWLELCGTGVSTRRCGTLS